MKTKPVTVHRRTLLDHPTPTPQPTPCRLWQGATSRGYGVRTDRKLIHRWVVAQIHGWDAIEGQEVRHLCDQPLCYRYDHLAVGSHADNMADMMTRGRHRTDNPIGERHWKAKLTEADVLAIRAQAARPRQELADEYGMSIVQINKIIQRRAWKHLG